MYYNDKKCRKDMKVGDLVYAKHPRMYNTNMPGIIVKIQPMYKHGNAYKIMFPVTGLHWIQWAHNLIKFEDMWSEDESR